MEESFGKGDSIYWIYVFDMNGMVGKVVEKIFVCIFWIFYKKCDWG